MSSSQNLGGATRCGRVIGPSLDKIIKNAAWRKHTFLVSACKSVLDKLEALSDSPDPSSPLFGLTTSDADAVLQPLLLSLDTGYAKVIEPALDCSFKLFSLSLLRGEVCSSSPDSLLYKLIHAICKVCGIGEESIELAVLRVLLAAVRSPRILIRGDCLLHLVRTCYNVYLGGFNGTNQICAKSVLAQIMLIVFTRSEANSMDASLKTVNVNDLLAITDKNVNEGNSVHICQGFINDVITAGEAAPPPDFALVQPPEEGASSTEDEGTGSKIREDGFLLFKNLCKLSMKFSSQENTDDQILVRGKTLSLELLKVIIDNGGPIWLSDERFLNAIKQLLCLSLLKNSALSVMSIFQLQCAIFTTLLRKYRSGMKSEVGIFFPMLVLRVLENVLQPSFVQKMTVLSLLENICHDPNLIIDIFVNFDCDVESPNIFERIVNGLLKTALGPPPGSSTILSPVQDITFRHESVKCLVSIIKAMGTWMDQQLSVGDSLLPKSLENEAPANNHSNSNEEDGTTIDHDFHPDLNGIEPVPLEWGAPDAKSRGPIIVSRRDNLVKRRNAIGAHGGSYSIYNALAIASGDLDADFKPDLRNSEPTFKFDWQPSWADKTKIVSMDPYGHDIVNQYREELEAGWDIRPTMAVTRANMKLAEIGDAVREGRLQVDGNILVDSSGEVRVTKVAVEPVWFLAGVAERFGVDEGTLRRTLFEQTGGSYPELITRPDLKIFLPPIGGLTVYIFGPPERVSDENVKLALRIHDECNGSDVFQSDICTCRPYLAFGIEEAIKEAQNGGSGVVIYFRKEGRALGEVIKYLVYNARKRGGDTADKYFTRTENIAGVRDMRFQALMPDILHWLGIKKIDRMLSMSNMKHDAIVDSGIKIHERVPIPEEMIPNDSRVEIDAKINAGYFTTGKQFTMEELAQVKGRGWEKWEDITH